MKEKLDKTKARPPLFRVGRASSATYSRPTYLSMDVGWRLNSSKPPTTTGMTTMLPRQLRSYCSVEMYRNWMVACLPFLIFASSAKEIAASCNRNCTLSVRTALCCNSGGNIAITFVRLDTYLHSADIFILHEPESLGTWLSGMNCTKECNVVVRRCRWCWSPLVVPRSVGRYGKLSFSVRAHVGEHTITKLHQQPAHSPRPRLFDFHLLPIIAHSCPPVDVDIAHSGCTSAIWILYCSGVHTICYC